MIVAQAIDLTAQDLSLSSYPLLKIAVAENAPW